MFDKNKAVVVAAQAVVFVVLGILVALGHDSVILDALLAVGGSITGIGLFHTVSGNTSASTSPAATTTTPSSPDKSGT